MNSMQPMIRSALVLLAGVVAAVLVVTLMDWVVASIFPFPDGTDLKNPENFRQAVAGLPTTAFLLLVVAWSLAGGVGSYVAARLSTHARVIHGLIVALFVLVATISNLARIPHPTWMWPAAIILIPVAGWVAARLAAGPAAAHTSVV